MAVRKYSPLLVALYHWAHGAEPELRCGDIQRLNVDLRELLEQLDIPTEHITRICGEARELGDTDAVVSVGDHDNKRRRDPSIEPPGRVATTAIRR